MTRTRTAALCLEAAERDMRSATWSEIDAMHRQLGEMIGVTQPTPMPEKVLTKVAKLTRKARPLTDYEKERAVDLTGFINRMSQYANDAEYRAKVDAERAARQAEVYARMDAAAARYRERNAAAIAEIRAARIAERWE